MMCRNTCFMRADGLQVDVVVSPVKTALLGVGPAAYPLTMGDINLVKLCKLLRPQVGAQLQLALFRLSSGGTCARHCLCAYKVSDHQIISLAGRQTMAIFCAAIVPACPCAACRMRQ